MKRAIAALLLIFVANIHALASMPIEFIKDLDLTNEGYDDLNALHGIPWNEGILENHGELLPQNDSLRRLIQNLFHRTGTFDPSTSPKEKSVVSHLTPFAIGQFVGALKVNAEPQIEIPSGKAFSSARGVKNNVVKLAKELKNDPRVYRVFLALLWAKAQEKSDFAKYYEGVRKSAPAAVKDPPPGWLTNKFEEAPAAQPPLANFDEFLFWAQKHLSDAPSLEHQDTSNSRVGSFADCGETSLRNFFKLMLDDNGDYVIAILDSLNARQEVKVYFRKYPNRKSQTSQEARNEWADLTTGHDGVKYVGNGDHELDAGAGNMFALIKVLLPEVKATDWEELAREIEDARKKHGLLSFNIEQVDLPNDFGEIRFRVEKLGGFKWLFQPQHFYIEALPAESLGEYPEKGTIKDIAVYYPQDQLTDSTQDWYLYAKLRENENIEKAFTALKDRVTVDINIGLLNRLSTADAKGRIFSEVVTSESLREIVMRKDFQASDAYLGSLLGADRFDDAKILVQFSFYKKDIKQYFIGHSLQVNSAVFSPKGERVLTASSDKTARIWDSETGKEMVVRKKHSSGVAAAVFSPDGERVLTASKDKTARIWNSNTGKEIIIKEHGGYLKAGVFSPNGERILTASRDKTARIWNSNTGKQLLVLKGHTGWVNSAVFSPDGAQVVTTSDETPRIWDSKTGDPLMILKGHTDVLNSAVFSPNGERVLTASKDKTARIWDLETGAELVVLKGHTDVVTSAVFSPDGERILTASNDKTARIWDSKTGKELAVLRGHTDVITSAVFSPDGEQILTASNDKTARIWKLNPKFLGQDK